jgi:hypothetical protein
MTLAPAPISVREAARKAARVSARVAIVMAAVLSKAVPVSTVRPATRRWR